jgi:hypothetical protein
VEEIEQKQEEVDLSLAIGTTSTLVKLMRSRGDKPIYTLDWMPHEQPESTMMYVYATMIPRVIKRITELRYELVMDEKIAEEMDISFTEPHMTYSYGAKFGVSLYDGDLTTFFPAESYGRKGRAAWYGNVLVWELNDAAALADMIFVQQITHHKYQCSMELPWQPLDHAPSPHVTICDFGKEAKLSKKFKTRYRALANKALQGMHVVAAGVECAADFKDENGKVFEVVVPIHHDIMCTAMEDMDSTFYPLATHEDEESESEHELERVPLVVVTDCDGSTDAKVGEATEL